MGTKAYSNGKHQIGFLATLGGVGVEGIAGSEDGPPRQYFDRATKRGGRTISLVAPHFDRQRGSRTRVVRDEAEEDGERQAPQRK
jgi:hypothetical protein